MCAPVSPSATCYEPGGLGGLQLGHEVEQAEPVRLTATLDTVRIAHAAAQDLQTAADAEHRHAGSCAPGDRACDAGRAQPLEIGQRALGARDHDRGGVLDLGRTAHVARMPAERRELVVVRDPGQGDDGDAPFSGGALERDSVLLGQRDVEPGNYSERGHARAFLEPGRAGRQQSLVTTEAVEQEAREQPALGLREAVPGAEQVRERAAPVDVAAQQHGRLDLEGDGHVDDVAVAQVDLRRAACALDHDDVVVVEQAVERVADDRPEVRAALAPGQLREREIGRAQHDDLGARVGLRLDQHRVHARLRRDARGRRLHDLRPAELAAVVGHAGVVAHVLGLERRDAQALVGQQAAERGSQIGLAGVRRAALHHEGSTHR